MVSFASLESVAPTVAAFLRLRIETTGLCMLGTTRSDGWPRVSPIELSIVGGSLYVGSMPDAVKVRDLRRDPRCCVITPLADKDDLAGEGKAFCRAHEVTEVAEWERVRAAFHDKTGFDIGDPGGSHIFGLEIESAAWQRVEGDDWRTTSWSAAEGVRERVRHGPLGESLDISGP